MEHKMGFDFFYKVGLKYFSFYEELRAMLSSTYIGRRVK